MDQLDAILEALRLESAVAGMRSFGTPFGIRVDAGPVAAVHFVLSGTCSACLPGGTIRQLGPGDALLLPHGAPHEVSDRPGRRLVSATRIEVTCPVIDGRLHSGGQGQRTDFLCGGFRFARGGVHRLFDDLPAIVVTNPADGSASPTMVAIQQAMALEIGSGAGGQSAGIKALFQAWFVAFLRSWINRHGARSAGWMAGLHDERLARVMAAIHRHHAQGWTIATLATQAGMSRSRFAAHFREVVGETPLTYLNRWRVQCAGDRLRAGESVDAVARAVGFAGAAVLIRVFKRYHGQTPGAWLRTMTDTI